MDKTHIPYEPNTVGRPRKSFDPTEGFLGFEPFSRTPTEDSLVEPQFDRAVFRNLTDFE